MASILDCEKIQPQLSEYIDGAVDNADTAWAIKLHLSSCAVCTQVVEELTQTAKLLRNLPSMDTSAGFEAALARRLADQVLQPKRPGLFDRLGEWLSYKPGLRPAFASAAALAAVVPVALVLTNRHNSPITSGVARTNTTTGATAPNDASLNELWNEHMSYASSEPLADSSADMLEAPTGVATAPPTGNAANAATPQTL